MLTTLLSSIQSQLTGSKSYLLTALFPVSVFLLASAALLYRISPMFRAWTSSPESGGVTEVTLVAIAWLTLAYLLSALGPLPLEVLEGKHPPISWLAPSLCARHWKLRRELNEAYIQAVREDGGYERRDATWKADLEQARAEGIAHNASSATCVDDLTKATQLRSVLADVPRGKLVSSERMHAAVNELAALLRCNSTAVDLPCPRMLEKDLIALNRCRSAAWARHRFERIKLFNERQFQYPPITTEEASSVSTLAPTRLGNIGRTPRSYALSRYGIDLDIFWTRLQKPLQNARDFNGVLQDAKLTVDSLASLTWMSGIFSVIWMVVLFVTAKPLEFLLIGLFGPLMTVGIYSLTCRSYMLFTDLLRSAVDLFRLDLLREFHLALPYGSDEEKRVWSQLGRSTGYGDEEAPLTYDRGSTR